MKSLKIIAVILIMSSVLSLAGCFNFEYKKAIKNYETTDRLYIGVREDLTIVSNIHEEVNLTDLGLNPNAYFLYGDADYMYFGIQAGRHQQKITVMEYSIHNQTIRQCAQFENAYRVMSPDGENFYFFQIEEKQTLLLAVYKYKWKIFKFEKDATSGTLEYEEEIESYPTIGEGDRYIQDYMAKIAPYRWMDRTVITDGETEYEPSVMTSQDEIWSMIKGGHAQVDITTNFYPTLQGNVVMRANFEKHHNYFEYSFGGDIQFLFAEKETKNPIVAIYTMN